MGQQQITASEEVNMGIRTLAATTAVLAGTAIALAAPASADDFSGVYTYNGPPTATTNTTTWTVTPCGPGCAHVVSASGETNTDAHLVGGSWTFQGQYPDAFDCADGSIVPGIKVFTLDPNTLQGQIDTPPAPACGSPSESLPPEPFTLTKIG